MYGEREREPGKVSLVLDCPVSVNTCMKKERETGEVSAVLDRPVCRGMEAVVVAGGKVHHAVVQLVSRATQELFLEGRWVWQRGGVPSWRGGAKTVLSSNSYQTCKLVSSV